MNKVCIFAGTHEQARILARWHEMAPSEWAYVDSPAKLKGMRQQVLWLFGTWRNRSDARETIDLANAAGLRVFTIEDDRHLRGQA